MKKLQEKLKVWISQRMTRRAFLFLAGYCLVASTTLMSCSLAQPGASQSTANASGANPATFASPTASENVFHVARQKQLIALAALEKRGTLEKALEPLGFKVSWDEYAAGPQQLEALNAESLDLAYTAESPPVFAQAANAPLVYLAATPVNGRLISLLVPKASSVQTIADLRGKRFAIQKASIGHYLLLRVLEKNGMKLSDVQSVFLPPPDANVAFSEKQVDAWFIWELFVSRAVEKGVGRVILDGGNGLRDTTNFYSTRREFYEQHPDVLKVFFDELEKTEQWAKNNRQAMTELLAPVTQLTPTVLDKIYDKTDWGIRPISDRIISKQQQVANQWFTQKLIPQQVDVKVGFLKPEEYDKLLPAEVLKRT